MENVPPLKELLPKLWHTLWNTPQGTVFVILFITFTLIMLLGYGAYCEIKKHLEDESK